MTSPRSTPAVPVTDRSTRHEPISWDQVQHEEGAALAASVGATHGEERAGLAFSGGGIRSATFCLGVIQGMAAERRLSRFDYLATVSGGGYIGSWLSALICRRAQGDVRKFEEMISPAPQQQAAQNSLVETAGDTSVEHPSLQWLRKYRN